MPRGKFQRSDIGKTGNNIRIEFDSAIHQIKEDLRDSLSATVQDGFYDMVMGTPVDTGYAQASWDINEEGETPRRIPDKLPARDTKGNPKGAFSDYYGFGEIFDKADLKVGKISTGKLMKGFSITNTAPYIVMLEHGWSSQSQYWIRAAARKMAGRIGLIKSNSPYAKNIRK